MFGSCTGGLLRRRQGCEKKFAALVGFVSVGASALGGTRKGDESHKVDVIESRELPSALSTAMTGTASKYGNPIHFILVPPPSNGVQRYSSILTAARQGHPYSESHRRRASSAF